ncbi:hypothetical protein BLA29_010852 [Euroglyphus maynei]|uniref:Uncharacterized protein n=1 Tax=Euroglyphus maynei TaxID=6958 RepID=A0A1Y3BCD5_EURMA|nr:hypothetical protein BLA29_010852 [Euroglyphus maynei]
MIRMSMRASPSQSLPLLSTAKKQSYVPSLFQCKRRKWRTLYCLSMLAIFIVIILPLLLMYRLYWFRDFVYIIR